MGKCKRCSSYAINHNHHGRDGSDPDLCDVCYWRKRSEMNQKSAETAKDHKKLLKLKNDRLRLKILTIRQLPKKQEMQITQCPLGVSCSLGTIEIMYHFPVGNTGPKNSGSNQDDSAASSRPSSAPETYAAWEAFEETGNIVELVKHSIRMEIQRDEMKEEAVKHLRLWDNATKELEKLRFGSETEEGNLPLDS